MEMDAKLIDDVFRRIVGMEAGCTLTSTPVEFQIFFIRHSESCANVLKKSITAGKLIQTVYTDPELSSRGVEMVKERALQLPTFVPQDAIVCCSPLFRAQQTAMYLAPPSVPIVVLPYIQEVGGWQENNVMSPADREKHKLYAKLPGPASRFHTALFDSVKDAKKPSVEKFFARLGCHAEAICAAADKEVVNGKVQLLVVTHSHWMTQLSKYAAGVGKKYDNLDCMEVRVSYDEFGKQQGKPRIVTDVYKYTPSAAIPPSCPETGATCRKMVCPASKLGVGLLPPMPIDPLFNAIQTGQFENVKTLLKGRDVNKPMDRTAFTPLYIAAINGHFNIVEYLLTNGANLYLDKYTVHAAKKNKFLPEINRYIIFMTDNLDIDVDRHTATELEAINRVNLVSTKLRAVTGDSDVTVADAAYLLLGHGGDRYIDFEKRFTLPPGVWVVTQEQCGRSVATSVGTNVLDLFVDDKATQLLQPNDKAAMAHVREKIGGAEFHIYGPGDKCPHIFLNFPLEHYTHANSDIVKLSNLAYNDYIHIYKSGVYKYPIDRSALKPMPAAIRRLDVAHTGKLPYVSGNAMVSDPVSMKQLLGVAFEGSLYPTRDEVLKRATGANSLQMIQNSASKMNFIGDIIAKFGRGIYYSVGCRGNIEPSSDKNVVRAEVIRTSSFTQQTAPRLWGRKTRRRVNSRKNTRKKT